MGNGTEARKVRRPAWVPVAAGVAVAYVLGAEVGLALALVGDQVTPMWPPTGIALVALFVFGRRALPGIAAGAFLVNAPLGSGPVAAGFITIGNTLAPLAGWLLLRRLGFHGRLGRLRDAVALVGIGALASSMISATGGTLTLLAAPAGIDAERFLPTWSVWWTGDAMGVLVVAPLLLVAWRWRDYGALTRARRAELVGMLAGTGAIALLITHQPLPLLYLLFPMIIWAALRFRIHGAAPVVATASIVATLGAAQVSGPFLAFDLFARMVTLQAFNASAALVGLLLAGMTAERDEAVRGLESAGSMLEARVTARTAELTRAVEDLQRSEVMLEEAQRFARIGSWEWWIASDRITWTDELYRLYGLRPGSVEVDFVRFMDGIHPDDRAKVSATVAAALEDHEPFAFDHRVVWPDGSVHWLHGRGNVELNEAGEPVRMYGTSQDIEERKRAEETARHLREARGRRRQALEFNDEIVQGLSIAAFALANRDAAAAQHAVAGTLSTARHIVAEMLGEDGESVEAGDLVRARPAKAPRPEDR